MPIGQKNKLLSLAYGMSLLAFAPVLSGCSAPDAEVADNHAQLTQFVELFDRNFETESAKADDRILDQRTRINSPSLNGYWYYVQLNTGADNKLYRQRVANISMSEDGRVIVQHAFGLKSPEAYVDAWNTPDLLAQMSPDDFEPYFDEGCDQIWTKDGDASWNGYVDPDTCKIFSERRNADILIESEGWLGPDAYKTNERGYSTDKEQLWGTNQGEFIKLVPVK